MVEPRDRLLDDLRDIVTGDVHVDDLSRAAFSTDASILQVWPQAIVAPRTTEELCVVVRYASETGLSIHPRGAGTGLAGESLGAGIVIDTSRFLTKIDTIGRDWVRVEPGVRWAELQQALEPMGRMFGPDPVSGDRCTLGGMVATNAAGPHSLRYGSTRDYVLKAQVVLASGELVELTSEPVKPAADYPVGRIASEVAAIVTRYRDDILAEQSGRLIKSGGYQLRGLLDDGCVHLARLMAGSEGTLAVIASVELATLPIPRHRGILLACCRSLDSAAHAVVESLEDQPTACELMDRRLLTMVRDSHPKYRRWISETAEALLLIEQEGANEQNVHDRIRRMADRLGRVHRLVSETVAVFAEPELSLCWRMRNQASSMLSKRSGPEQPIPFVENTAVPPEQMPALLKRVQDIMKRYEVTASYAAHAGVGVLHTRPLMELSREDHRAKLGAIAVEVQQAALDLGGTNNGEHGVGLLRSGLIRQQYPRLYPAFCAIKGAFDPKYLLNPGRIVGAESGFPTAHLRTTPQLNESAAAAVANLVWGELPIVDSADRCNGCGSCQTRQAAQRMCPTYKALQTELASPRSKANLLRQVLRGGLDQRVVSSDAFRTVADLCIHCGMCRTECPSGVDISKLMLEAKAANVAEHGLSRTDWVMAHLEQIAAWCSGNSVVVNAALRSPATRWLIEKWFGVSRQRPIPRFHHTTFLRRAARNGWTRKPKAGEARRRAALFCDVFVNHVDPHLGECAVRVLEHAGIRVYVPPLQRASGMSAIQVGDLETARACLSWNLNILAELVREGFEVVCVEPSSALVFRHEARGLMSNADIDAVADHTCEFSEFLAMLAAKGALPQDLAPIPLTIGYHEPCHERAIGPRGSAEQLFQRIPQLRLIPMDLGCSGMAGLYGLRADGYEISLRAGDAMLRRLAEDDIHVGMTQCAACRMQMEHGSGKRTLHPAEWFAIAYGLTRHPERLLANVSH